MNPDEQVARVQAEIAQAILQRFGMPSIVAFPDAKALPPSPEPLLLPPANPVNSTEVPYDEQDIDGYTIAEAQAALDDFKRRRQRETDL